MFDGTSCQQGISLIGYLIYQTILVIWYFHYRQQKNNSLVFYVTVALSFLPIVIVKLHPGLRWS